VTSELQEADWNRLLRRIQSGKCTPFLGAGACYGALPLGADVAEELAQRYAYPFPDRDPCACCAVCGCNGALDMKIFWGTAREFSSQLDERWATFERSKK
jgi:hypothetical protein